MESYYRCDGRSLEILYERWGPRLEEFLRRQNFSKESAEDLCEETFVQVMKTKNRQVARYDPQKGRFCTWLWGIARNLWRDAWKRRGQRLPVFARHPTQAADPVRE
ncbi:MAG: hypothetical protein NZ742_04755, partial [Acidobacteria bacterium]|nr:hypothetical protein [Acidobacteriota bacterium]